MSEELADLQPSEQTQAPVTEQGTVERPEAPAEDKFPEFKATPDKSVLRQQIEHAAKVEEKKRGNPYKSADGKFAKKPLEPREAPETAAPEATPESEPKPETQVQPQAVPMPKAWAADKQALWDQLPQAVKDFLITREDQVSKGFADYGEKDRRFKAIDSVLAPLDPMIQGYGTTREAFVGQLANWHLALSNNPNEAFPALARAYGYNLGSTVPDGTQPMVSDPRVDQVSQSVAQINQRLAEAERRESEALMRQTSEHVANWAKEKPHYEKVRQDMGLRIKAAAEVGREMSLDEAYEASIWANPEIRNQLMKEKFEAEQKAAQDKARKSQLAAVSATTRPPQGPANGTGKPTTLRDTITAAVREHQGAGRA